MLDHMQAVRHVLILVAGLAACQRSEPSVRDQVAGRHGPLRSASLGPWEGIQVGEASSFDYLLHRTAIQWDNSVGLDLQPAPSGQPGKGWVGVAADGSVTKQVSAAVPIGADGYFLTAGHCVGSGQCLLLCGRGELSPIEVLGTVIWNGLDSATPVDPGELPPCDLAVVYAPSGREELLACMPWSVSATPPKGAHVLVGGAGATTIRLAGGVVLGSRACTFKATGRATNGPGSEAPLQVHVIRCDAPLVPGDSGGPAILKGGTLLGVAVTTSAGGPPRSTLLRPDLEWLSQLLTQHRQWVTAHGTPAERAQPSALGWIRLQQQRAALEAALPE